MRVVLLRMRRVAARHCCNTAHHDTAGESAAFETNGWSGKDAIDGFLHLIPARCDRSRQSLWFLFLVDVLCRFRDHMPRLSQAKRVRERLREKTKPPWLTRFSHQSDIRTHPRTKKINKIEFRPPLDREQARSLPLFYVHSVLCAASLQSTGVMQVFGLMPATVCCYQAEG